MKGKPLLKTASFSFCRAAILLLVALPIHFVGDTTAAEELVEGVEVDGEVNGSGDWEGVYLANYVEIEDLPVLKKLGINTVLMEFDKNPNSWTRAYDAIVTNDLHVVPVLWGKHQSIWNWNKPASEWELDEAKYPKSPGAKFISFLKENEQYRAATFAVYSFHEPWYIPDGETGKKRKRKGTVTPEKQKKFWSQIRSIFQGHVKVYGEEVTWVPECKNGCVDYDYVTLYSFAKCGGKTAFRPGGRFQVGETGLDGSQAPCQLSREQAKQQEREQIALMHRLIQAAPKAADGTRTKLIALMGTFAHDEEPDLWNRMPTAAEMVEWPQDVVQPNRQRLAGMGWYAFRNPTDYYKQVLHSSRRDPNGKDRWQSIRDVFEKLYR